MGIRTKIVRAPSAASGRQRPLRNAGKYEFLDFGGRIFEPATWVGVGVAEAPCGETPGKTQKASEPPEWGGRNSDFATEPSLRQKILFDSHQSWRRRELSNSTIPLA